MNSCDCPLHLVGICGKDCGGKVSFGKIIEHLTDQGWSLPLSVQYLAKAWEKENPTNKSNVIDDVISASLISTNSNNISHNTSTSEKKNDLASTQSRTSSTITKTETNSHHSNNSASSALIEEEDNGEVGDSLGQAVEKRKGRPPKRPHSVVSSESTSDKNTSSSSSKRVAVATSETSKEQPQTRTGFII